MTPKSINFANYLLPGQEFNFLLMIRGHLPGIIRTSTPKACISPFRILRQAGERMRRSAFNFITGVNGTGENMKKWLNAAIRSFKVNFRYELLHFRPSCGFMSLRFNSAMYFYSSDPEYKCPDKETGLLIAH